MDQKQVHQCWLQASEKVKDRLVSPTLYRALEAGVGITIDGDEFVVGFSSAESPLAGHLRSSKNQAIIEQCVSEVLRTPLRIKIVEGTTLAEYESQKQLHARRIVSQTTLSERRERDRAIMLEWEAVAEKITRGYAKLPMRQMAQSRGMFVKWAFEVINDAVNKFNYSDTSDEIHIRALNRVFEKFSTVVEVPSTMLAYEFFRLREEKKLQ